LSILKALTEAMRDVMDQRQIPIPVFSETINWYDQHIGEFISGKKGRPASLSTLMRTS
jgi:hypothetical protein